MFSLSFVPILFKFCYAESSTYPQTGLLVSTREMFEETLAIFEMNLKVIDLYFELKYHTSIRVFSHIFVLQTNFRISS